MSKGIVHDAVMSRTGPDIKVATTAPVQTSHIALDAVCRTISGTQTAVGEIPKAG